MAAIKIGYGAGGVALQPGHGTPSLDSVLRDIADDFATVKVATIASADASDLGTAITLVNEIKGALNTIAGGTILTTKA